MLTVPQVLFAAVVLGVSISLATRFNKAENFCDEVYGHHSPDCNLHGFIPAIEFSAFVGAFGLLDSFVGLAACFLEVIPYVVNAGFDALADLFFLAGGVVSIPVGLELNREETRLIRNCRDSPSSLPASIVMGMHVPASEPTPLSCFSASSSLLFSSAWASCGSGVAASCTAQSDPVISPVLHLF